MAGREIFVVKFIDTGQFAPILRASRRTGLCRAAKRPQRGSRRSTTGCRTFGAGRCAASDGSREERAGDHLSRVIGR